MKFVNVKDLKNHTSEILRSTDKGQEIVVTSHGKPRAVIHGIKEEEMEDYVLMNYPQLKAKILKGYREYKEGKTVSIDALIKQAELGLA